MNRYEKIADELENKIAAGTLLPGDKLPSVRELSVRERVSATTVVDAYGLLQQRGRIESRDRSGFYVASVLVSPEPKCSVFRPTLVRDPLGMSPEDLVEVLRQAAHDPKILPLGAGTPSAEFYPYRAINRCISHALREEPALTSEYVFPPGSLNLRRAIARRLRKVGVEARAEAMVTTSGAIDAIQLALRAVTVPGDVVLVESPTYFGILQTVRSLGLSVVEIPADPTRGLSPERFEAALLQSKQRIRAAVLIPTHANPLGSCMPERARAEVVAIAARVGVTLIEDDVYGDLPFSRVRPHPMKTYDGNDTVILCGSFSKTVSAGLRVGYALSEKHASAISALRVAQASATSTLAEESLALYLEGDSYDRHLRRLCREYKTLTSKFAATVLQKFPEGTRVASPQGGYVLWVQLPVGTESRWVQKRALENRISIAPGTIFSARSEYRNFIRLNCAVPWGKSVERGLGVLGRIVDEIRAT